MPSLRHRREDHPRSDYFVRETCAARRVAPKTLSRAALSLIGALPWRGNAVVLRTLLDAVGSICGATLSGSRDGRHQHRGRPDIVRLDGGSVVFANGGTLRQARARFEREYITAVLEQNHGRITDAAKT